MTSAHRKELLRIRTTYAARRREWLRSKLDATGRARCAYCDRLCGRDRLTVDHIQPLSKGGYEGSSNYAVACRKCNTAKADKTLDAWRLEQGKR